MIGDELRGPRLSRRRLLAVAGAVGIAGLAAACAPGNSTSVPAGPSAAPRRGGTLTYVRGTDAITLDPPYAGDLGGSGNTILMLFEGLVGYDTELEIRPLLAASWDVKDTIWTFKLRPGVKFHDGTPFNAAAGKAHFDRLIGAEKPLRASAFTPFIDKVEAIDETTLRFATKFVDAYFLTRLADISACIGSPAAFQKYGKDGLAKNPVGTGPFRFVEWIKDEHLTLARNDEYWGDKAYLDRVVIRPVPDAEARAIALESGDVQLAGALTPEQIARLQGNPKLIVITKSTTRNQFVGMAALKKPFSDVRVRRALNYAIDKDSIVKNLFAGTAEPLNGAVAPGVADYFAVPGFAYDPIKARQLLAEAGYANGFSTTLVGTRGQIARDFELQQIIQQQLKAVGVDAQIQSLENAKYLELLRTDPAKSPLEMYMDNWGGTTAADVIENRYGCNWFRPKGQNTAGFCDSKVSDLAEQALKVTDVPKRQAMLKEAQELLSQDAPSIWLFVSKSIQATDKRVHNAFIARNGALYVDQRTWLDA